MLDHYQVKSLPNVTMKNSPDIAAWESYRDQFGATAQIFFEDTLSVEQGTKILSDFRKKNSVPEHKTGVFSCSSFFDDPNVINILGQKNIDFVAEGIQIIKKFTLPIPNSPNGMAFFLNRSGLETPLHNHPFDHIYDSGPQMVIWANERKRLPQFWFEQHGRRQYWPDLSASNVYCVEGKIHHGGEAVDYSTIYLISVCRKLLLLNDSLI